MEEDKITLDQKSFKVLSSGTRISILKSLTQRRKMLTELSKELGMSVSTIKEHLEKLSEAGLVVQRDDGHKWKYYELTGVAEKILNPGYDTKIWVLLSVSGIALLATAYDFMSRFATGAMFAAARAPSYTIQEVSEAVGDAGGAAADALPKALETGTGLITYAPGPELHMLAMVVLSALVGLSAGYLWLRRKRKLKL